MRRKHEEKVYQSLLERNMDNLKHAYFFAIDSLWYNRWKSFINNDEKPSRNLESFNKYISDNKKIGVLPPGIIDNSLICEINREKRGGEYKLKIGLKKDKDFVIVNQYLWEWFLLNYNGGPEIQIEDNIININNKEKYKEKEMNRSNNNINEKTKKYRKDMDNKEEINEFNKLYNSKLTDIKAPKQKIIEDKVCPEVKMKLIKSLISNINI